MRILRIVVIAVSSTFLVIMLYILIAWQSSCIPKPHLHTEIRIAPNIEVTTDGSNGILCPANLIILFGPKPNDTRCLPSTFTGPR